MKHKILFMIAAIMLLLAACGPKTIDESMTLLDHEQKEVTVPQDKPIVLFYITTYT